MDVIAQAVGIIAMCVVIFSFQCKKNRNLFLMQGLGGLLFALNYLLLGSLPSAGFNVVSVICSAMVVNKKTHNRFFFVFICLCYAVVTAFTYESLWTLVLLSAQFSTTYYFWYKDGAAIRKNRLFFASPIWLINNIFITFTIGGILCEIFCMASTIISFIRFRKTGFTA